MADISLLRVDESTAEEGVWTQWEGIDLRIASTRQRAYEQAERRALAPHRKRIEKGEMSARAQVTALARPIADHLLRGWRNLTKGGVDLPYSKETARELLTDEGLLDLTLFVFNFASESSNHRAEHVEESEGN